MAVYAPTLGGGFSWDDNLLITENRLVHASDGLCRFWMTTEAPDYYPLTSTLWWLQWRWWRDNATGYHLLNIVLHTLNGILIWKILRRLQVAGAWFSALVFLIHPVNVATAGWISEQKNTLSMLFFCLAVLLYLSFDKHGRRSDYWLSWASFALALLAKSAVVMLPAVLLGCIWWQRRRLTGRDLTRTLPFFALALALGLVTVWFQYHRALQGQPALEKDFLSRLAIAGCVPWFYLWKVLLPVNLSAVYPKWDVDASHPIVFAPGILILAAFVIFWSKRGTWGRAYLFGLGYFLAMLFPVMGFFDQGYYRISLVADHWQYYAIIGVIALVIAGAKRLADQLSTDVRQFGVPTVALIAVVLGIATFSRSSIYANQESLWCDSIDKNPNAWLAYNGLGFELERRGRPDLAIPQYEQAIQIQPNYPDAHNNLGVALFKIGKIPEAIQHYQRALAIKTDYADAHFNLGTALWETGRANEAIPEYEAALRSNPEHADAHNNLAIALAGAGRTDEAIQHWEQTLRINPSYAQTHYNLALALERLGKRGKAIDHYSRALQIEPSLAEARKALSRLQGAQ